MWSRILVLGAVLALAPPGARAADLVVWWDKGFNPEEDEAVREIIAAFEQKTSKQVELDFYTMDEHPAKILAALEADRPPDFAFGFDLNNYYTKWALEDRLVDLSEAVGHFSDLFDPAQLDRAVLLNARTNQKHLYGLPMGFTTNHLHVWKSLLERAGFSLDDVPKEWEAFWSFWCDQVQPAVRRATGRDDIYGVGLAMSAEPDAGDTADQFFQFVAAYEASYVTREGKLIIDDPEIRRRLIKTMDSYTAIYRKGCTPTDSIDWTTSGNNNNQAFLTGMVVMTPNYSLSIPNAMKWDRPDDYYHNTTTIEWPLGPYGGVFPIPGFVFSALVFKDGRHVPTAEEFVRFLVSEGWLALSQLLRRAYPAVDLEASRPAVLARPERPAPHGRGDAGRVATHGPGLHRRLGRSATRPDL